MPLLFLSLEHLLCYVLLYLIMLVAWLALGFISYVILSILFDYLKNDRLCVCIGRLRNL